MTDFPIVNSSEISNTQRLWLMWAGAYAEIQGYVWAESEDDAFERWVEWLDEHAPGVLVPDSEFSDLLDNAARNLGYDNWPQLRDSDSRLSDVALEDAEADLTPIGHTTMKSGHYICSWEWGLDEVESGSEEYRGTHARTLEEVLESELADITDWVQDAGCGVVWMSVDETGGWQVTCFESSARHERWKWVASVDVEADSDGHTTTVQWEYYARELVSKIAEEVVK